MTGRYHGQPMKKHLPLSVDARHFDRWLDLFEATARELCPPKAAEHFVDGYAMLDKSRSFDQLAALRNSVGSMKRGQPKSYDLRPRP